MRDLILQSLAAVVMTVLFVAGLFGILFGGTWCAILCTAGMLLAIVKSGYIR